MRNSERDFERNHMHNGISYPLSDENRCAWYSCIHNMYDGDYPDGDPRSAYGK